MEPKNHQKKEPISWATILTIPLLGVVMLLSMQQDGSPLNILYSFLILGVLLCMFIYALASRVAPEKTEILSRYLQAILTVIGFLALVTISIVLCASVWLNIWPTPPMMQIIILSIVGYLLWQNRNPGSKSMPLGVLRWVAADAERSKGIRAAIDALLNAAQQRAQDDPLDKEFYQTFNSLDQQDQEAIMAIIRADITRHEIERIQMFFPLLSPEHQEKILEQIISFAAEDIELASPETGRKLAQFWPAILGSSLSIAFVLIWLRESFFFSFAVVVFLVALAAVPGAFLLSQWKIGQELDQAIQSVTLRPEDRALMRSLFPDSFSLADIRSINALFDAWLLAGAGEQDGAA